MLVPHGIQHRRSPLGGLHDASAGEGRQVARNSREVEFAALSHFTNRTRPSAFRDTRNQPYADWVTEGLEQFRIEEVVQHSAAGSRMTWRARPSPDGRSLLAYLHHDASIDTPGPASRPPRNRAANALRRGDQVQGRAPSSGEAPSVTTRWPSSGLRHSLISEVATNRYSRCSRACSSA